MEDESIVVDTKIPQKAKRTYKSKVKQAVEPEVPAIIDAVQILPESIPANDASFDTPEIAEIIIQESEPEEPNHPDPQPALRMINNNDLKNLIGKWVVITDATSGISKRCHLLELSSDGNHVFVKHNRDQFWISTIYDPNIMVYEA